MPHGRSDRDYPSERPRHPREHPVVPRGNWREDQERYYRRSDVRRYSSDEDGVLHKDSTPVKSSVKVVNRVRKIVRSRSTSPRDKGKARITTVKRVSSETKLMPERVKPKRKSAEVKGTDTIKAKRYVHKFLIWECLLVYYRCKWEFYVFTCYECPSVACAIRYAYGTMKFELT